MLAIHNASQSGAAACSMTIEVTGEGTASAAPDLAVITAGVELEGKTLQELQRRADAAIASMTEAWLRLGIPRERIGTAVYRIEPQYDYEDGKQTFRGFKLVHLLQATMNADQAGEAIDAALSHGANTVQNVSFASSEASDLQKRALAAAARDAAGKAEAVAAAMGVALSAVPCKIEEIARPAEPVLFKAAMAADGAAVPIEPGQLTFQAALRVWYWFG